MKESDLTVTNGTKSLQNVTDSQKLVIDDTCETAL